MALFEVSLQGQSDMLNWLNEIKIELEKKVKPMNDKYNYDFNQDLPYNKSNKYDWFFEEEELTTKPSKCYKFNLDDSDDSLDEIPEILDSSDF